MMENRLTFNGNDLHQSILNKAAQDKFAVILDVPPYLREFNDRNRRRNDLLNLDTWRFSPASINIPEISVPAIQQRYNGQTVKMTSQSRPAYPPLNISFQIDNNYNNYHFLWLWFAVMNHPTQSGMDTYWDELKNGPFRDTPLFNGKQYGKIFKYKHDFTEYKSRIVVQALREYNEPIAQFTFYEAFPVGVGGIEYDYRRSDLLNSKATFEYNNVDFELLDYIPDIEEDKEDKGK